MRSDRSTPERIERPAAAPVHAYGRLVEAVQAEGAAALVSLIETQGSSPREAGAWMVVRPSGGFHGTIGGGAMEWRALEEARALLAQGGTASRRSVAALGPELAQCCGGRVEWRIETFGPPDLPDLQARAEAEARRAAGRPVWLFGAGHVGRALALALAPLPFAVRWIDSRPDGFPERAPAHFRLVNAPDPPAELAQAPDGAFVVIMTHSHPLDLAIVVEAVRQGRFGYVGLIGSATKRARFLSQMRAAGLPESALASLVCPIGIAGLAGKEPAVIAASVAAQLLVVAGAPRG